jgi:DNA polymerase-3 subunit epsilon
VKREIVLDTETTGLNPATGDRIVEIGCVELINHIPTGRHFHAYLNPERDMADDAFRVHGLSDDFLRSQPRFADRAAEFLAFVEDSVLIAHNAGFDITFLNAELERAKLPSLRNEVIDTVAVARDLNPGARVGLDALCKYYGIDNSKRTLHGALLDSQILAEVYLELIGGRQVTFALVTESNIVLPETADGTFAAPPREFPLPPRITPAEIAAHLVLVATLGADSLWSEYLGDELAAA